MTAARLGASFDLLAAWQDGGVFVDRDGEGIATGPGASVAVADVVDALRDRPDGAVAAGALPFAGGGSLVIGDDQVRRTDPFVTTKIGEGAATLVTGVIPAAAFGDAAVTPVPSPEVYGGAVQEAVRRIRAGGLRKVVLARTIEVVADRTFDARRLAHRLRAVDPHAFSFIAPAQPGVLVGASPELLISRQGSEVRANPLAGSAPRSGDLDEDRANAAALAASAKDREEHAIVVDAIVAALQPLSATLTWDPEPVLLETANVWHLSTRFRGRLVDPAPTALDLALALHPTPAVAGAPTDGALAAIGQLEGFSRGAYAGPVGWVDADGNGTWAIALRCALLSRDRATLYAGAGIVAASDPAEEIDETDRKFRASLDALRWG
ncbi:MAG TPA: isochorismate synthase [Actinomycetota bacterium]|nr:isochorismate synthase [Actinomycetota bacterium]